jgi:FkbM family methyltransferase
MISEAPPLYALLPAFLPRAQRYMRGPLLGRINARLGQLWHSCEGAVKMRLHGFPMLVNGGYTYPFILQNCPMFNAPLIELSHLLSATLGRPIHFVDVGAALGDTVALIKERCPGSVGNFTCIEGDDEFHELLTRNMAQFDDVTVVKTMLAREPMEVRTLIKQHKGTASATGEGRVNAVRLDSIDALKSKKVDLIKVDVDGFDGEVLAGATGLLRSASPPAVIFEWHPKLCQNTGNDPVGPFETLVECGYTRFAWFGNLGEFSHFSGPVPREVLEEHARYLVEVNERRDEHFDVIALPPGSSLPLTTLAILNHARLSAARH